MAEEEQPQDETPEEKPTDETSPEPKEEGEAESALLTKLRNAEDSLKDERGKLALERKEFEKMISANKLAGRSLSSGTNNPKAKKEKDDLASANIIAKALGKEFIEDPLKDLI